jgi:hypothetical protein
MHVFISPIPKMHCVCWGRADFLGVRHVACVACNFDNQIYIHALYVECWFLETSCNNCAAGIGRRRSHYEVARMLLYADPFVKPLPSH